MLNFNKELKQMTGSEGYQQTIQIVIIMGEGWGRRGGVNWSIIKNCRSVSLYCRNHKVKQFNVPYLI